MAHFTQADLDRMGLQDNGDGTFSKKKTVKQPREMYPTLTKMVQNLTIPIGDKRAPLPNDFVVAGIKPKKPKKEKPASEPVFFKGMNIQDIYDDGEKNGYIFIKGNVPSFKNSKQLFKNKKTGKNFITSSDLCKEYIKTTEFLWRAFKPKFLKLVEGKSLPYKIQFIFIRDTHKPFDYGNISEIIFDCMTGSAYYPKTKDKLLNTKRIQQRADIAWIADDNCNNVIPNYGSGYKYDPLMPGVIIRVL